MKSTKILSLILVAVMCFTMLASCIKPDDGEKPDGPGIGPVTPDNPENPDNPDNPDTPSEPEDPGHEHVYENGKCSCGKKDPDHVHAFGADGFCVCGENDPYFNAATLPEANPYKQAEYNTTTSVMPSNWNELTYQDNNDTQIMSYLGSSFFDYDFKFNNNKYNADGTINADAIVDGGFSVNYSAATKLEDVTATVDGKWGYTPDQKAKGGYAWKITLRDDLKWHDGTEITAADFIYSMQQQLDPKFMNYRGNTFYDNLVVKNAKKYFFQNQEGTYELVSSFGYENNAAAIADGKVISVDMFGFYGAAGAPKITSYDEATFKPVLDFENTCPEWAPYNDNTLYFDYAYFVSEDGYPAYVKEDGSIDFDAIVAFNETAAEKDYIDLSGFYFSSAMIYNAYASYFEVGASYESYVGIFVENTDRNVPWESVGMYLVEGENAFVICLEQPQALLNEDGSLSLWAAYYMSSLPLVHKEIYEANKHEPTLGATLWTSTYNSSLESTASWGPYMLAEFEAGSHYKLVKNENWYGWNMIEYKNQYNVTAINCRKVDEWSTQWMGFLKGDYDDSSIQTENYAEYKNSKYLSYTPSSGTFGMQLYSNLPVLKASKNNNGILAIQEFRHAFNLALNRSDIIEKIWPGSTVPCFGLVNSVYFYDVENAPTLADGGIYRNTVEAKEGLLRAYGYTYDEATDRWSIGDIKNLTFDEAYDILSGYNMPLAKEKMKEAIAILEANADYYGYDSSKPITIIYGSSTDNDKQRFRCDYLQGVVNELTAGTSLEGKITLVFDASAGAAWSDAFRNGDTQIGFGYGFSGNAFNPFNIIGAFVDPDDNLNYHAYWDTSSIELTITMPEGDYDGAGETLTMSLQNWYYCLNGLADGYDVPAKYNFNAGYAPTNARLVILAALEEVVLKESRSVMLIGDAGGSFLGAKFSQLTDVYNTFMGYGGIRYMVVEYTDDEWYDFVEANDLREVYKQSE